MLEVRKVEPEMTYYLRQSVLRPNQPIEASMYEIDHDENSFHVAAFYQERLISVVSFIVEAHPDFSNKKQYRLRQMATHQEYRNLGAGKAVVCYGEKLIKERGYEFLWCKGRTNVQGYYQKLGFHPYGEVFDYPPIGPHIIMYKYIL